MSSANVQMPTRPMFIIIPPARSLGKWASLLAEVLPVDVVEAPPARGNLAPEPSDQNRHRKSAPGVMLKRRQALAAKSALDQPGHVAALLHRDRGNAGQRRARWLHEAGEIGDHEDLRMLRETTVRRDQNAAGAVERRTRSL